LKGRTSCLSCDYVKGKFDLRQRVEVEVEPEELDWDPDLLGETKLRVTEASIETTRLDVTMGSSSEDEEDGIK
jgi:hypothetical protein